MTHAARQTNDRLTDKQHRALKSQCRRLGIDDDTYRSVIAGYPCVTEPPQEGLPWPAHGTPCVSSRHLSRAQGRRLITRWTIAGAPVGGPYSGSRVTAKEQEAAGITPLPTPAQRALIARLVDEITWRTADGYRGWLAARLHLDPTLAPRTYREAEAIIEGLRAMRDRRRVAP